MAEISGLVLENWTLKPVPGAKITVQESGEVATADDDGRFQLHSVEQGLVHLNASADGYSPGGQQVDVDGSSEVYPVRVYLRQVVNAL